ncbi:MAG: hypothetical protein ACYC52_08420, partial [Coriobacteriia bacterium]
MSDDNSLAPDEGTITWEYRIPLLTSRFMWWDMIRVIAISVVIMWVLVAVMGWFVEGEFAVLPWFVPLGTGGMLLVLFALACLLLGNGIRTQFAVGPEGVSYASGKAGRRWNRLAIVAGVLAGSPGTAGAGLLAASQESGGWTWAELHRATEHPNQRVIALRNSWRTVLRLHCPPELYEQVRVAVAAGIATGSRERGRTAASAPARSRRGWPAYAGWVVAPLLAGFLVPAWYALEYEDGVRFIVIGVLLVIAAGVLDGPVRRMAAALALAPITYVGFLVAREMLETSEGFFPGETRWGFQYDTEFLAITAVGLLALAGMAAWWLLKRE